MIRLKKGSKTWIAAAVIAAGSAFMAACGESGGGDDDSSSSSGGGSGGGDAPTDIIISGQLALTGESISLALTSQPSLEDLSVYCVTFEIPPVAGTGAIDSSGNFELTLKDTTDA